MNGGSHALSGWCTGLAAAPLVGLHSAGEMMVFGAATAGYALLPDLDHDRSTASRLMGPFTRAVCWVLRHASAFAYRRTKGPKDEHSEGTHRHLSHTAAFAVAAGLATVIATLVAGVFDQQAAAWTVVAVVAFGVALAQAAVGDWVLLPVGFGTALWMAANWGHLASSMLGFTGAIGAAVALGCITHCLGDTITKSGCPWLWPILIKGERWYEIRPPAWLRFRTGGKVERYLVHPMLTGGALLLTPGVLPAVRFVAGALIPF